MTIERRVQLTAGVLILFALAMGAILSWSSHQVGQGIKDLETTSQLINSAIMLRVLMDDYLEHGGNRPLRQWDRHHQRLGRILKNEKIFESADRELASDLRYSYEAVSTLAPQVMQARASTESGDSREARDIVRSLMSLRLEQLMKAAIGLNETVQSLTLKKRVFVGELIVATGLLLVGIIVLNVYLIRRSVLRPLKELAIGAERVGAGTFDFIKEAKSDDDVGTLTRAFNIMVERLRERTEALSKSHHELEQKVQERTAELESAKEFAGAQRQRLFDILETMPVMVCLLTPDYHVAFANRSFREKFGEAEGRHCYDHCFGQEEPCEFCQSYRVLETGKPHHWEYVGPDGSIIDAYDFPFTDTNGSKLILKMDIDITEQRRAQEALTAERERLYDVLETLPVYVCLLDADYHMPFANRYFRETFGESRGCRCHEFLFNRAEPCETCETYTVMKTRAPHHWYWTGPNERDYDIYDFPFIDTDGSFLILEMGIDITERNQAENALKQTLADLTRSNKDLEQFAYVASHDLQEPLRNVASCVQMLEQKYRDKLDADADRLIGYAVESATRMKALINDLLAYSRVSTKGNPFWPTDCEEVLQQTLANLKPAIEQAGAVITREPLPTVYADPTQLMQVFQNLIGNAIKFHGHEPPKIRVSATREAGEWIFSITDNGIGIEPRHLERIFVIFQRLHKRAEYDGTGMGLAIVKRIIDRHRGRIWAESKPREGATFYFTIPAKERVT